MLRLEAPVKFAVVGLGSIGPRHLAVLDAEPRATIVAICDVDPVRREKYSTMYGGVRAFEDYQEMLRSTSADVISICTPHGMHAQMAMDTIESGRHVLVEKPMALTVKDAESMEDAAKKRDVLLSVVKQNRYNVPVALTKEVLDKGLLGRVFMVHCNVLWTRHEGYYADSDWRGKRELEGGALFTQASHFIDLMIWWFGDVVKARGSIATKNHKIEVEDCGTAEVEFASGTMGTLVWTTCTYNQNYEGSITIIGEHGTIKIGGQYLNGIDYWDVKDFSLPDNVVFLDKPNAYGKYQGTSSNHDKVIKDLVAMMLGEGNNCVLGGEGIKTIKAIEMIYQDARR
jgi:UDP-N-acetyl-2-amino-2-deoxyglucuronate dehydrogenase